MKKCILLAAAAVLAGCVASNDRIPTTTDIKQADTKRQSYIDSLSIPEADKAAMKAHMGGSAASNQADAASQAAARSRPASGRR